MNMKRMIMMVFAISFGVFLVDIATDILLPSLPYIEKSFNTNIAHIQYLISANLVGIALSSLISGAVSDIYGRRRVMLFGMLIFVIASLILPVCATLNQMIGFRFLQGLGGGVIAVVGIALYKDLFDDKLFIKALSFTGILISTSPALAPMIGVQFQHAWHYNFYLVALLSVLSLVLLYLHTPQTSKPSNSENVSLIKHSRTYLFCLLNKQYMKYNLISALVYAVLWLYLAYLPYYLISDLHMEGYYVGSFFLPAVILGILGMLLNTKLIDHYTISSCLYLGIGIAVFTVLTLVALTLTSHINYYNLMVLVSLFWFGGAFVFPNASDLALTALGDEDMTGTAVSLFIFSELFLGFLSISITALFSKTNVLMSLIATAMVTTILILTLLASLSCSANASSETGVICE